MHAFRNSADFIGFTQQREHQRSTIEAWLARQREFDGYCPACREVRRFQQRGPAEGWSDLRENLVCPCGLNGRMRMLFEALEAALLRLGASSRVLFFEQVTPLFARIRQDFPFVEGCEYVRPDAAPGSAHEIAGNSVRHEDICATSFPENSLDLVFHGDVLEHVADWRAALRENARILRPGGILLFTAPVFQIEAHKVRAEAGPDGIRHRLPPAYHGNPMSAEGSLVYTEFSLSLVDELAAFGFVDARIECVYDPFKGIVSNNNPYRVGRVWPIWFEAVKP